MKQDIGLYQWKYGLRKLLDRIPAVSRLEPNAVSAAALVPAALTAVALANRWWLVVAVGIVGRLVLSTLDGLIAERYGKRTRVGGYANRVPAEIGDALVLVALWWLADPFWVLLAVAGAWLVNVFGLLGLVADGSTQSVGPAGQTDRQAMLLVASLLALAIPVDWTMVCQVIVGAEAITVVLRIRRSVGELTAA